MRSECSKFDSCTASICPLSSEEENKNYIFYPDEEVCNKNYPPLWVKNQKKIAQRSKDKDTYYTIEMLKRKCIIKNGIMGLDPDQAEEPQLKKWLKTHPTKREKSEEEKNIIRERFARVKTNLPMP
jgi:hypothetical protein